MLKLTSKSALLLTAIAFLAIAALAQDSQSPSLGDVARQARQQKQQKDAQSGQSANGQSKDNQSSTAGAATAVSGGNASSNSAKPAKHVITNDEIPEHVGTGGTSTSQAATPSGQQPSGTDGKASAEQWKSQILALKNNIAQMQKAISDLSNSIQYAGANCVANCAQWNEHQKQKQDQVDTMKSQLEQQQKALEDMQDAARRQGYGTSVYDP